ncbi:hypothetical protein QQG55_35330 [Brugia pahangi]
MQLQQFYICLRRSRILAEHAELRLDCECYRYKYFFITRTAMSCHQQTTHPLMTLPPQHRQTMRPFFTAGRHLNDHDILLRMICCSIVLELF